MWLKYSFPLVAQILVPTWLKYSLTFTVEAEAAKDDPEPDAEKEIVTFTKSHSPKSTKEELLKGVPVKEKVIPLPEAERVCQK